MRKIITILILFMFVGCIRIPGNYTPTGKKNYIESEKRIRKEHRQINRSHRKQYRRIYRLQHQSVEPYKHR